MLGKSSPKIEVSQKRDLSKERSLKREISQKRDLLKERSLKREISQKRDLSKGRSPKFRDSPDAAKKLGMQACKQASITSKSNKNTPLFLIPHLNLAS